MIASPKSITQPIDPAHPVDPTGRPRTIIRFTRPDHPLDRVAQFAHPLG
jgi:hypothetical protein